MSREQLLRAGLGLATLEVLGFQPAQESTLGPMLRRISPEGGTAMRDSVIMGITMMLKLYAVLAECGIAHTWNFVHVVLTDGADTSSKTSLAETCDFMRKISQVIPVRALKTFFIGIDLYGDGAKEINALVRSGGENAQFFNVSDANIDQIFSQLTLNIGLVRRTQAQGARIGDNIAIHVQQDNFAVMTVEEQHYVVLFNLDVSGSMAGSSWNRVCNSVNGFINQMGNIDLVAGLVFNTEVMLITQPSQERLQELAALTQRKYEKTWEDYMKMFFIFLFCMIFPILCCFCGAKSILKYDMSGKACIASVLGIVGYINLFILMNQKEDSD